MKRLALAGMLLCSLFPAQAEDAPPADMATYLEPGTNDHAGISDTVYQMLNDAGRTVGFQGGKAQRAYELRQALTTREATLSAVYDFRPLISRQGYLPPVIDQATDLAHITPDQIRTAYRTYTLLVPARFVSNPPSWRHWLLPGLASNRVPTPDASVRPKNGDEEDVWQNAIKAGWDEGRVAADRTLEANFNRLTRDYTGMLRYSTLLQTGLIEAPSVTEEQQSVTGNHDQLLVGDKVKRIKEPAGFIIDKHRWKPVVRKDPH